MTDKCKLLFKGQDGPRQFSSPGIEAKLIGSYGSYLVEFTNTHPTMKLVVIHSAVSSLEIAPGGTKRNYWEKSEQWRSYTYHHETGAVQEEVEEIFKFHA